MTITEAILQIVKKGKLHSGEDRVLRLAKIYDVTGSTCSVIPLDSIESDGSETIILDVRLQVSSSNGFLLVPSVGSIVMIAELAPSDYCVIFYSALDSIKMLDGSRGGLVDVGNLVDRINNMENKFNAHVHSGVQPGGGTSAIPTTQVSPITQISDIENPNILHGNP